MTTNRRIIKNVKPSKNNIFLFSAYLDDIFRCLKKKEQFFWNFFFLMISYKKYSESLFLGFLSQYDFRNKIPTPKCKIHFE